MTFFRSSILVGPVLASTLYLSATAGASTEKRPNSELHWTRLDPREVNRPVGLDNQGRPVVSTPDNDDTVQCHTRRDVPEALEVAVSSLRLCTLNGKLFQVTAFPRPGMEGILAEAAAPWAEVHEDGTVTVRDREVMTGVRTALTAFFKP